MYLHLHIILTHCDDIRIPAIHRNKYYAIVCTIFYDLSIHPLEFNSSRMIENRIIIVRLGVRSAQSKSRDDYDVLNYVGKVHRCSISNPRDIMKRCTSLRKGEWRVNKLGKGTVARRISPRANRPRYLKYFYARKTRYATAG